MELEIISEKTNPLLQRVEIRFRVKHERKGTPKREELRELLATRLNTNKERIVISYLNSEFGRTVTNGYAKLYDTKELLMKLEPEHILVRNKFKDKVSKTKREVATTPKAPKEQ